MKKLWKIFPFFLFFIACSKDKTSSIPIFEAVSINDTTKEEGLFVDWTQTQALDISLIVKDKIGLAFLEFCIYQIPQEGPHEHTRDHVSEDLIACEYFDDEDKILYQKYYVLEKYKMDLTQMLIENRQYHLVLRAVNLYDYFGEYHFPFKVIHKDLLIIQK